ncbi:hypothetical protein [Xenorhabdus bovienii]|uniref:hypothetical protein n=1 Tax=Xenorhabdus bovienii TaxID=40576 RepID=UPI0001CA804B|nr:hypothetical protein [Xenorhabdus bovienii]
MSYASQLRIEKNCGHGKWQRARYNSPYADVWLAIQTASKKWTMPIQNWRLAMVRFMIEFGDRLNGHV